jgi:hypothetical protein
MPDLNFQVEGAEPQRFAAAPLLLFKLRITEPHSRPIHSIALRCQIQIEPARRRYTASEQERLLELFGVPERWGQTVRPFLWSHANVFIPSFTGSVVVDVPVPCSFDFSLAATKYFDALDDGDIPLSFLFSGTIFHETDDGRVQVAQVPWHKEATYRLWAGTWKELMRAYYPQCAWLCLPKGTFDRLARFKAQRGLVSFEQALEQLLAETEAPALS